MFRLGDAYPAAYDLLDASGNPVSAATVTLTITLPDGGTVTPAVTNPPAVTGQYRASYTTTMAGRHVARWLTTSPDTAFTDAFEVAEAVPPAIISLADAKRQLGIAPDDTSMDAELWPWLIGVTEAVEDHKAVVYARRSFTETVEAGWSSFRLTRTPVASIQSVAAEDGSYAWDVANLVPDSETGLVRVIQGPRVRGRVVVTYTAGPEVVPYKILQGALVLLQHLWETRRGPGRVGGGVVGPEESADWRHYTMWPRKITEWLGPPGQVVM